MSQQLAYNLEQETLPPPQAEAGTSAARARYYLHRPRPLMHGEEPAPSETGVPESISAEEQGAPLVVMPSAAPTPQSKFHPLQKWEGYVLKVEDDTFVARLADLSSGSVDEEAEFLLDDVPESDQSLVEVGAIFYWDIGYLDKADGQRIRGSSIRFRRLPTWSASELKQAEQKARQWSELFAPQEPTN